MSVLFMLGWLWYGLIGFLVLAGTLWQLGLGWVERDGIIYIRHRKRWLEQHFGEEGAKRWLAHEQRVRTALLLQKAKIEDHSNTDPKMPPSRRHLRLDAQMTREARAAGDPYLYSWCAVHGADGMAHGTLAYSLDYEYRKGHPPWGCDMEPYKEPHGGQFGQHQEPKAVDWFAAGFWEKGLELAWAEACSSEWPDHLLDDNAFYYKAQDEWKKLKAKRLADQKGLWDRMMAPNPWADGLAERLRKEAEQNKDPELEAFIKHKVGTN